MKLNLSEEPFKERDVDLKVYFGSKFVDKQEHLEDLHPDRETVLCASYPNGPITREFIANAANAQKDLLSDYSAMNVGVSSKKKGKRQAKNQDLTQRFEQLEAEVTRARLKVIEQFEMRNENMREEIDRLKADHEVQINWLKVTVQKISNEVARLNIPALHRRVMLDDIRKKLVAQGVIQDDVKPTQNLNALTRIVSLVKEGLRKNGLRMLSDPAIMVIFDTNETTLRGIENDVAHKASKHDIAGAVLDPGLSETDRAKATELFRWLNGQDPKLQHNA